MIKDAHVLDPGGRSCHLRSRAVLVANAVRCSMLTESTNVVALNDRVEPMMRAMARVTMTDGFMKSH
jgi:hypothetical protein